MRSISGFRSMRVIAGPSRVWREKTTSSSSTSTYLVGAVQEHRGAARPTTPDRSARCAMGPRRGATSLLVQDACVRKPQGRFNGISGIATPQPLGSIEDADDIRFRTAVTTERKPVQS